MKLSELLKDIRGLAMLAAVCVGIGAGGATTFQTWRGLAPRMSKVEKDQTAHDKITADMGVKVDTLWARQAGMRALLDTSVEVQWCSYVGLPHSKCPVQLHDGRFAR